MIWYVRFIGIVIAYGVLAQGCSTTLQSSWRDFNAYFNTYYNAKTSFERGVVLQKRQNIEINPERPIRIHPAPTQAGRNEFEIAAQKSADVIRFHPRSRWVDNAIEMIGMSYFYQQQYFSADQKFVELLTTTSDPDLRQRAIYWRGRSALELENYVEGINYIQSRLFSTEFDWDPEIEAEIKLIVAQLYVARNEYDDAEVYLAEAIPDIRDRELEMKAHFLHGQLLESLERYDEAFEAYKRATHRSNPNYDLIYHAELKLGIVARNRGDLDWAYSHFTSMSRDDRHYSYRPAIEYEVARTLQKQRLYSQSYERYKQTLQRRSQNPTREVHAKIYYSLAEIYRDHYLDYTLTAAYFDSSSQQATNLDRLPKEFDASIMSRSYGEYSRLQNEIHRLDSLLWLGGLSEAEFDSVIVEIRQNKIEELERQQRDQRRQQMISVDNIEEAGAQADDHSENGFLNYKNPQLMQQMSQAFQAYWGARPLVDDWRRMEAVRVNIVRQFEEDGEEVDDVDEAIQQAFEPQRHVIEIDFSDIPFSDEDKRETRRMIASYEYEIGNVFFTSLAMPDSASIYFRNVMSRFPDSELAPQAIYSLSELYDSAGDSAHALQYAMQLVDFYPHTIYAERMADRYKLDLDRSNVEVSQEDSLAKALQEIKLLSHSEKRAVKLRKFAENHPDAAVAPEALYRSILDYIETARTDDLYALRLNDLAMTRIIWEQEKDIRETFRDSVRVMLADSVYMAAVDEIDARKINNSEAGSHNEVDVIVEQDAHTETDAIAEQDLPAEADTLTAADSQFENDHITEDRDTMHTPRTMRQHLQEIADKTIEEPDLSDLFPYEGELWDSARVALIVMRDKYPDFPKRTIVNALADEIEVDRARAAMVDTERLYPCNELDQRPEIMGGIATFLRESGFQDVIDDQKISASVAVKVIMDKDGNPVEVRTDEEDDGEGLMEALLNAVRDHMRFDPPEYSEVNVRAECEYNIEFNYED